MVNLALYLARSGHAYREAPAIARGGQALLSYGALADRIARLAGALRNRLGLKEGDRVALAMRNCPEYLEILYACWHAGLIAAPMNSKLHPRELDYILRHSGARVCFATADIADAIAALRIDGLELIEPGSATYANLLNAEPAPMAHRAPEDGAWLFYTSGTTGRPKGALLTHRNLLAMSFCYFADVDQQSPWRAIVHAAPMSHASGLYALPNVMQGSCHVIPESGGFDESEVFDLFARWPGAAMFAVPTMVRRLTSYPRDIDASGLKTLIYGGGPMYVEDCLAALDRFGPRLAQLYGQGETPMTITALSARMHAEKDHPRWRERLGSVGVAQSAVEVRVADPKGASLPAGEAGEILVRGETVMREYWNAPEATAAALADGWLHTGDIGAFDEDGFLTLKDRAKDLIITGGSNVYPREVEEVLLKHPSVAEACVIGRPDPEWGECVVAYVVTAAGARAPASELDALCLAHVARFKRPADYVFVDALPKSDYGKVLKTTLRERDAARSGRG